jgi:hypothetical protein
MATATHASAPARVIEEANSRQHRLSSCVRAGQDPAAVDKQYVVRTDGVEVPLHMSQMVRRLASLTKSGLKAWLHSVARQQSLGKRGLPGIWLVEQEILERYGVDDALPADIAAHVQLSLQKREKRNSRSVSAPAARKTGMAAALARTPAAPTQTPESAARAVTSAPAGSVEQSPAAARLQQLAAAGCNEAALQEAALQMRLAALSASGEAVAMGDGSRPMPAHSLAPPDETLEETEARLARTGPPMKQAIFAVLRDAGPDGLSAGQIVERLGPRGFVWDAEGVRGAKSSVASTCGHDGAFVRLCAGVYAVRALPGALDRVDASASACSREVLEVRTVDSVCTSRCVPPYVCPLAHPS